jgi:hypothetical protein
MALYRSGIPLTILECYIMARPSAGWRAAWPGARVAASTLPDFGRPRVSCVMTRVARLTPWPTPEPDNRNGSRCPPSRNAAAWRYQPAKWRTPAKKPWGRPALAADRRTCAPEGFPRFGSPFWNDMEHSIMTWYHSGMIGTIME